MSKPSFPKMINAAACSPTACTQPENRLLLSISNCRTCIERVTLNNPSPPQGEGNRPDPGSLISTLVLPPATSLCPPRTMPQPQVQSGPSQGAALGGISGTWVGPRRCPHRPFPRLLPPCPGSILFTSTHHPRGTKGDKGCPVLAHPHLAFRKTVSKKQ